MLLQAIDDSFKKSKWEVKMSRIWSVMRPGVGWVEFWPGSKLVKSLRSFFGLMKLKLELLLYTHTSLSVPKTFPFPVVCFRMMWCTENSNCLGMCDIIWQGDLFHSWICQRCGPKETSGGPETYRTSPPLTLSLLNPQQQRWAQSGAHARACAHTHTHTQSPFVHYDSNWWMTTTSQINT